MRAGGTAAHLAPVLLLAAALWGAPAASAMACGRLHPDPECLDVFTHVPSSLPKCYCTDLCEDKLGDLVTTCASGQLVADGCGACLLCARARGQTCGGSFNVLGVCAGGLSCLIKFDNPEEEQVRGGVCVPQESPKCPRSTDKPQKEGVNCRTGQFGILAEALYCPTPLRQPTRTGSLPTLAGILAGVQSGVAGGITFPGPFKGLKVPPFRFRKKK